MSYEVLYPDGQSRKFDNYDDFIKEAQDLVDDLGLYPTSITFKGLDIPTTETMTMTERITYDRSK